VWHDELVEPRYRPDLAVVKDDRTIAVVEIKARAHTTVAWAEQLRRALLGDQSSQTYFIVAARDRTYVWSGEAAEPNVFDTSALLGPVLARARIALGAATEETMALAVSEWLLEFTLQPPRGGNGFTREQAALMDLGKQLRDGTIVREPVYA